MKTCSDLIGAYGIQEMADDIGTTYNTITSYRARNMLPHKYFPIIVMRAPMRGLNGITYELLFSLRRGRTPGEKMKRTKRSSSKERRITV